MARPAAVLCALVLFISSALLPLASVAHASARVEAMVEPPSVLVHIALEGVNASLYALMRSHPAAFNETTVPEAVRTFMLANGYDRVNYTDASISFDDGTRAVELSFRLMGEDVLSFRYNRTTMARLYELNVLWRRTDVVAREGAEELFRLNFSAYFAAPLEKWEQTEYALPSGEVRPALRLESEAADELDPVFILVLPRGARVLEAREDTLVFELPPRPWELFMASPFWPLMAVVAITGAAAFSRRAVVKWVRPGGRPVAQRSPQPLSQEEEKAKAGEAS